MFIRGFFIFIAGVLAFPGFLHPEPAPPQPQFIFRDSLENHPDRKTYKGYLSSLIDSGFSHLDLEVVSSTGNYYYNSLVLNESAWSSPGDRLKPFSDQWSRLDKSTDTAKIRLLADLSNLSWLLWSEDLPSPLSRLSPYQAEQTLFDLAEHYRFNEILVPPLPPEYMPTFLGFFQGTRKKLNLSLQSPYWDRYVASPEFDEATLLRHASRFTAVEADLSDGALLGRTSQSIASVDAAFNWARTVDKSIWMDLGSPHPARRNLILYRALQFAPAGWIGAQRDFDQFEREELKADFAEFYPLARNLPKTGRKVANLILGSKQDGEPLISEYIDPILNALQANGFEVHITFRKIEEGADLYYVVGGRDWLTDAAFFDALVDLMDHQKSRFYGTVVLHPLGEIPNSGPWVRIRKLFKIPGGEKGWIKDLPEHVVLRQKKTAWRANKQSPMRGMTRIRTIPTEQSGGKVALSQVFEGGTLALILKAGPHYLVNGNFLHLEASFFLSKMLGEAIQVPSNIYVTANRRRTCALAVAHGILKLKVPTPEVRSEWRLVRFNAEGLRVSDERIPGKDVFEAEMAPYELLLLDTEP